MPIKARKAQHRMPACRSPRTKPILASGGTRAGNGMKPKAHTGHSRADADAQPVSDMTIRSMYRPECVSQATNLCHLGAGGRCAGGGFLMRHTSLNATTI